MIKKNFVSFCSRPETQDTYHHSVGHKHIGYLSHPEILHSSHSLPTSYSHFVSYMDVPNHIYEEESHHNEDYMTSHVPMEPMFTSWNIVTR